MLRKGAGEVGASPKPKSAMDSQNMRHSSSNVKDDKPQRLAWIHSKDVNVRKESSYLVKGILPKHGLATIYGPSGEGKTFVALDMLMHVARQQQWFGHRTRYAPVLYLCPDGGAMVQHRIVAWQLHHDAFDMDFVIVPSPIDLLGTIGPSDTKEILALIATIEAQYAFKFGVVVIDTVSRAMPGGDENSPRDMTTFIASCATLQNGTDRLVIAIHHTPKSDGTVLRGHSSLHGACDCEINVNDKTIRVAKLRDGPIGEEIYFDLEVVDLGTDDDGDPITSCVVVKGIPKADRPKAEPEKRLSERQSWLVTEAYKMLDNGCGFTVKEYDYVVAYTKDLRKKYNCRWFPEDPNGAANRQAWIRDKNACVTYFKCHETYFFKTVCDT